ncbi:hypothetical protein MMC24_005394 [Lignoscripta atroalba]|nr:hypothetical protein [Lignoscripta atroalba]
MPLNTWQMQEQLHDAAMANTNIAVQVSRLPQAPMIQSQAILAMIQAMRDEFRSRDHNMLARFSNGRVALPQTPLRVLHDLRTNQPIANFPANLAEIQAENRRISFRELLEALGTISPPNAQWSIEEARQDFRVAIGCLPI